MTRFGYKLMSEEHGAAALVRDPRHRDELLDEALRETFPASDVPAITPDQP